MILPANHRPSAQPNAILGMFDNLDKRLPEDEQGNQLRMLHDGLRPLVSGGMPNLHRLLPTLLNLKGSPYTLDHHFPFEPFFSTLMPRNLVLKTGRQVSKSTSLAAQGVIIANCIPFFNTLYVTPLYEMIRRFSNNYVRGFIDQSPIKNLWTNTKASSNVLQRSFINNSSMHFSFAFLDADRTRGLNCDKVGYDEVQDLDETFIPIIAETMSGSPWGGISQYTGTPKTLDGTLEKLWLKSSMAEWVTQCPVCRYFNVPSLERDLDDMIGPWHDKISEEHPATVCAECARNGKITPINPRTGQWYHTHPEKSAEFAGFHVPQIIMPMHYADPDKWAVLLDKRQSIPANVFYNEVCGESYDTGAKLVTLTDLKNAAILGPKDRKRMMERAKYYQNIVLAIDWGGGGQEGVSYTVFAVLGMLPDGKVDVIYGLRSLTPHDHLREAKMALELVKDFNVQFIAHDYTGAGALREQFVIQAGFPYDRIVPMWYVRAATQGIMRFVEANPLHPRSHYKIDKSRSLVLTCHQIKAGGIRFFDYDYKGESDPGLLRDFLSLTEERTDSRRGRDIYTIVRGQNTADDFAHAVNLGACCLYHMNGAWPNIAELDDRYNVREDILAAMAPSNVDWDNVTS